MNKILITGACGQIGTELAEKASELLGHDNVVITDIRKPVNTRNPFEELDVLDKNAWLSVLDKYQPDTVFHLAALLSATGEKNPELAWKLNMNSLLYVLEFAREKKIKKVFWPSSIAVFGPTTPKYNVPQHTIMEPTTVYGISKLAGERWCEWYFNKFGVDVRSLRYPGLIGWKSDPGGGTTDYAVHIFYEALKNGKYTCFLSEDTALPMMCMEDAIRATLELMQAPAANIKIRSSYNLAGISFSPKELANEIKKHLPGFIIQYQPDFRQSIADSWPASIDDSVASSHWGWKHKYDLEKLTKRMISEIRLKIS
ncbi:MAG: NAD-dependent epimerase/dehydratase family protein [Bacteroidia bacterium]|nr:NAD-dependent epimerase/dehydratase family protein [Bacteroidia bacterium]